MPNQPTDRLVPNPELDAWLLATLELARKYVVPVTEDGPAGWDINQAVYHLLWVLNDELAENMTPAERDVWAGCYIAGQDYRGVTK